MCPIRGVLFLYGLARVPLPEDLLERLLAWGAWERC
jgi:hypothetical protein